MISGGINSFFSYYMAFGMCMGWDGQLVASASVANFGIGISLLGVAGQLAYIVVFQPNHLWMISGFTSVRLVLCGFFAFLGLHSLIYVVCIFYPWFNILLIIDVITMFLSFITMIIIRKVTLLPRKLPG